MCAPYVAVTSDQLSPTQRLVAEALTEQGLSVDTACVYSLKSSLVEPPRQRMYSTNNTTLNLLFFPQPSIVMTRLRLFNLTSRSLFPRNNKGSNKNKNHKAGELKQIEVELNTTEEKDRKHWKMGNKIQLPVLSLQFLCLSPPVIFG